MSLCPCEGLAHGGWGHPAAPLPTQGTGPLGQTPGLGWLVPGGMALWSKGPKDCADCQLICPLVRLCLLPP